MSMTALASALADVIGWAHTHAVAGVLLYALAYVAATTLLLPGSLLTLVAGFLWGPLWGTVVVSPVSVLAATAAFRLGRGLARERVARRLGKDPRLAAIDAGVAAAGLRVVVLLRLSPILPFNLMNYVFSLTSVRTRDYVLGSWMGMFPGTVLYVWLGSSIPTAAKLVTGGAATESPARTALFWLGLDVTAAATALIARESRAALARLVPPAPPESP